MKPLFPLGQVVATPWALETLEALGVEPIALVNRHVSGDWSDMTEEDRRANAQAIKQGSRVFSSYRLPPDTVIWIITEADRSSTTILLPEDY